MMTGRPKHTHLNGWLAKQLSTEGRYPQNKQGEQGIVSGKSSRQSLGSADSRYVSISLSEARQMLRPRCFYEELMR